MKTTVLQIVASIGFASLLNGCTFETLLPPTVNTSDVTTITETTAIAVGVIVSDNGSDIIECGVCWSTRRGPTLSDYHKVGVEVDSASFTVTLDSLNSSTTYYIRAYATNFVGTAYGSEIKITTKPYPLTTILPYAISANSAMAGGSVQNDSIWAIATNKGVCWSTSPAPTTADHVVWATNSGDSTFSCLVSGLEQSTTYYIRAFVLSDTNVYYGNEFKFTTLDDKTPAYFTTKLIGLKANFLNNYPTPATYYWTFGDGATSLEMSPTHLYAASGIYTVSLSLTTEGTTHVYENTMAVSDEVSLKDSTLVMNTNEYYRNGTYLDVDADGIKDFWIAFYGRYGNTTEIYAYIDPRNEYEVFIDSALEYTEDCKIMGSPVTTTKNIAIPKIYQLNSTLSATNQSTSNSINFTYYFYDSHTLIYKYCRAWIKDEIRYIGFKKNEGIDTKIGWIKLKVLGYDNMNLFSYKFPTKGDTLIIDK